MFNTHVTNEILLPIRHKRSKKKKPGRNFRNILSGSLFVK